MSERAERIFCLWDLNAGCNYRCPYCFFDANWDKVEAVVPRMPSVETLLAFWERVHALYGPAFIGVAGPGEPFLHPRFGELLAGVTRFHSLGITTNLSWDAAAWIPRLPKGRVGFHASFHPYFADHAEFLCKVAALRGAGFDVAVSLVAYPPLWDRLEEFRRSFAALGARCMLKPYAGRFEGRVYPAAYAAEQKEALRTAGDERAVQYQILDVVTQGKLCRAGQKAFYVCPDGEIRRCANVTEAIGHVSDPAFRLMDEPAPCPSRYCSCAALAPCLVDNDAKRLTDHRFSVAI